MRLRLAWLAVVVLVASCGSSGKKADKDAGNDAGNKDTAGETSGADKPAAGDAQDAPSTMSDAGDTAAETATSDAADGATCDAACTGTCVDGKCVEDVTIINGADLSEKALTSGRTCPEAPQYAVTALAATTATLAEAPVGDCLAAGDEVMLIDQQGSNNDFARVGTWELLKVASVAAKVVTFTASKTRDYGVPAQVAASDGGTDAAAGGDDAGASDAGASDGSAGEAGVAIPAVGPQKIVLIRVPRFNDLKVLAGATLTAAPWNGTTGGVLVLRAQTLQVDGEISAAKLGYRAGAWSQDANCSVNVDTQAGESISGPGAQTTANNVGGSGGIASATGPLFNNDTPICASPGHAQPGEAALNPNGRTLGQLGAAYGVADGTRLTMGSGPGGNLTCDSNATAPHLAAQAAQAAGVVALFVGSLTVGPAGIITATPPEQSRDTAYAGGYVFVRGGSLDVGAARVTAKGSKAKSGSPPTAGMSNKAGDGYVVLDATGTITGTTDPAAHAITH